MTKTTRQMGQYIKGSEMMYLAEKGHVMKSLNRLDGYLHNEHEIWRIASAKAEGATLSEIQKIKENPFYCNKCDLMLNLLLRTLYLIDELPELEEETKLIIEDRPFQEPNETTETEHDNEKKICPEKTHDTNAGFDLRHPGQSSLVIALHFLVSIDLKIALKISKRIDVKGEIINARYTGNIIVMLQNNSNKPYKIESHEKIAQALFLPLVKLPQLILVTTQAELAVNLAEEDNDQVKLIYTNTIQGQALIFEADPEICSLVDVTNLYLPTKAHKHFKIPIYNLTEDVIEISEGTLISSISTDIQNSKKPHIEFAKGKLSYANVFASENEFRHTDIVKHQIDMRNAQPIKQ
ncbi:hypothetical protein G9A89_017200 [Geosiphon pyriformis]|nr:hypothetical protein G9A89_017200 [Geosiphon pyriformis]